MSNLLINLSNDTIVCNGKQITFKAPCDCSQVTGIIIRGITYDLVDALGNTVTGSNSFAANAMVSVIIDTNENKAFLQNAASNGIGRINFTNSDWIESTNSIYTLTKELGIAKVIGIYKGNDTIGYKAVEVDNIEISAGGTLTIFSPDTFEGFILLTSSIAFDSSVTENINNIIDGKVNDKVNDRIENITNSVIDITKDSNWTGPVNGVYTFTKDVGTAKVISIYEGNASNGYTIINVDNVEISASGILTITAPIIFEGFAVLSTNKAFDDASVEIVNNIIDSKITDILQNTITTASTVDDLGTLGGMTLATLLETFDAWLDTHVGETGCSCVFIASAVAIVQNWMQGNFTGGIGSPNSGQAVRYNLRILVNTPNNSNITFLLTLSNTAFYIGTRTVSSNGITWSKIGLLFSGVAAAAAQKLSTARKIALSGDVAGSVEFDGSKNVTIETTLNGVDLNEFADIETVGMINYYDMYYFEDFDITDLPYQTGLLDVGNWDGLQAYLIDLNEFLDPEVCGWLYPPKYVQIIYPYGSEGESAIVTSGIHSGINGDRMNIDFSLINSITYSTIESPLLVFPQEDPFLGLSGTIIQSFNDIKLRFWFGVNA